jgi:hypothetical protein
MKKIDSLKVGAIRYKVEYVHDLKRNEQKLDGHIQHSQTKISLDAGLNHQAMVQTLLHEIVHAIATQIGRQEIREGVVDALAFGVYQVLRDNPALAREILK